MITWLRKTWDEHPFPVILISAVFLRLVAVIFARGWGMSDDHFLIIEVPQSWVDGLDTDQYFPWTPGNTGPTGHLLFYPGIHFLLLTFFKWIHILDPQVKMFIIRFLHAAFSMLTIIYAYRIVKRLSGVKSARMTGLLLAVLYFMPWLSVRNLVEGVCIPFLILGFWVIVRDEKPAHPFWAYLLAGIFFGLSLDIRLQTIFFPVGAGLVLLIRKQWKETLGLLTGCLLPVVLILGVIDLFIWGTPFAELRGYIIYNILFREAYVTGPWYNYILFILGLMIPPVSLIFLFGFFRGWKKYLILFLPALLFFVFHSSFPNKQERFIIPFIPFFIMLGIMGWNDFISQSKWWIRHLGFRKIIWFFFWIINLLLLPLITLTYSKRSSVETMYYLSKYPEISHVIAADAQDSPVLFPQFYLGQWCHINKDLEGYSTTLELIQETQKMPREEHPRFILFIGEGNLSARVKDAQEVFPGLVYETTIQPGFVDWLLHAANPKNKNYTVFIYRNIDFFPEKIESE